jgi:hypothetical protein
VQPPASATVAAVRSVSRQRQHYGFASVGIGGASPAFRSERAFDVAGFKLAGLLQQLLSAHIFLKIVALILLGAPVIWAWGCLYAAITGAPVSLGVFKVVSLCSTSVPFPVCQMWAVVPIACLIFALFALLQYTVILRAPGARVTEETSLPAAILINVAFITGMLLSLYSSDWLVKKSRLG